MILLAGLLTRALVPIVSREEIKEGRETAAHGSH